MCADGYAGGLNCDVMHEVIWNFCNRPQIPASPSSQLIGQEWSTGEHVHIGKLGFQDAVHQSNANFNKQTKLQTTPRLRPSLCSNDDKVQTRQSSEMTVTYEQHEQRRLALICLRVQLGLRNGISICRECTSCQRHVGGRWLPWTGLAQGQTAETGCPGLHGKCWSWRVTVSRSTARWEAP